MATTDTSKHETIGSERTIIAAPQGGWLKLDSATSVRVAALTLMEDWLIWFLGAIALLVAEMFTAGFWLACLAAGAVVAGIVALIPGLGAATQGIAFAAASLLSMAGPGAPFLSFFPVGARRRPPARGG